MFGSRGLVHLLIGATALLVAACAPPAAAPASAPTAATVQPIKITLGRGSGLASAHLVLAEELGTYKANGLDATVRQFASNGDAVNALVAGDIDGAVPSGSIISTLLGRNVDIRVLSVVSRSPKDSKLLATRDVATPADLRGRRVAVVPGTSSEMSMTLFLKQGGLTMNDVQVVKVDAPEVVAVMERGEADAFYLWEPFPSRAMQIMGDRLKVLAVSEDLGITGPLHQIVSGKFATENPDGPARLLKAYIDAEKFANENPQKALEIVAKANKLDVAEAKPLYESAVFEIVADNQMMTELNTTGQWMLEVGQLKAVPDYAKSVDTAPLQRADAARVKMSASR